MANELTPAALDQLFYGARTYSYWQDKPVSDAQLQQLFDLMKQCPTSVNSLPARLVFIKTPDAKQRLKPCLSAGNQEKSMQAPVTVIVAQDMQFYEHLPRLFPHADAKSMFAGNDAAITATAFRNSSLQGAYLIMAARSLGLDSGPMSGFDNAKLDSTFFPDGRYRSNFLINIGYGDASKLHERLPRFAFDEVCQIL